MTYKKNRILENYFKTNFEKNVLICYITHPFIKKGVISHTNIPESIEIAKSFKKLGYNCDIIDSDSNKKINYEKYDLVFGFGNSFEKSFTSKKNQIRIYYGTGKHPYFSNTETIKRGLEVKFKKGEFIIESLRLIKEDYLLQTTASDALILIGGQTESVTYKKYSNVPIENIPVSFFKFYDYLEIIKNKKFLEAQKHFLFFSGAGLIHKGLDLLLDFFSKQDDLHLHICTPINTELRFKQIYKEELEKKNIHSYDFISLNSDEFKNLITKCAFVILPSCSEAMPTSVVNVVGNGGLIPILSEAASINIDELTIPIKNLNTEGILESVKISQKYTESELKTKSKEIGNFVNKNYTIEKYSENIEKCLKKILYENNL